MRILVTGGAGFIGSHFVSATLRNHPDVTLTILDLFTYAACPEVVDAEKRAFPHRLEVVHGDVRDHSTVDRLVSRADTVVHFAAESHNDRALADAAPFLTTNVMGTYCVVEACARHDVRLHHVSTDEVFGDLPLDSEDVFTEHSPYRPSSPYSASKAAADHLVRAWARTHGLRATISISSNTYGTRQHREKFIPHSIACRLAGRAPEIYGSGQNVRDWIHVSDHVEAIWAILTHGRLGRTYLVSANNPRSNLDVAGEINAAFGRPRDDLTFVKDRPGHDLRYTLDPTLLTAETGWRPRHTDMSAGLREVIGWMRG